MLRCGERLAIDISDVKRDLTERTLVLQQRDLRVLLDAVRDMGWERSFKKFGPEPAEAVRLLQDCIRYYDSYRQSLSAGLVWVEQVPMRNKKEEESHPITRKLKVIGILAVITNSPDLLFVACEARAAHVARSDAKTREELLELAKDSGRWEAKRNFGAVYTHWKARPPEPQSLWERNLHARNTRGILRPVRVPHWKPAIHFILELMQTLDIGTGRQHTVMIDEWEEKFHLIPRCVEN